VSHRRKVKVAIAVIVPLGGLTILTLPALTPLLPARVSGLLLDIRDALTPDAPDPRPPRDANVLVVGDSLVARMPGLGDINLGVNGETVDDVRDRIPTLAAARPRRIVLLAGANDLLRGSSVADTASDYRRLLDAIPDTVEVVILSVPPMDDTRQRRIPDPETLAHLNARLARLAPRFVDLTQRLAGADGRIEPRFTSDGIHLNDAGYAAIADLVPTS
jgi:lysophospholipase L1-like esterase